MVIHVDQISTPPTPADSPAVFEESAAQVWSDLARNVPLMNRQADEIEAIGQAADAAMRSAQVDSDAAMGYRNEACAAAIATAQDRTETDTARRSTESAAVTAAESAKRAEDAADNTEDVVANAVRQTSATGAAILPEGLDTERPNPVPANGMLVRGNTITGVPEFYSRAAQIWIPFGAPEFSAVPAAFAGTQITVTGPHLRVMVWDGVKYVRAPWHQPGMLLYSYDNPASIPGYLPVRADVTYQQSNYPDLVTRLGLSGSGTFALGEARGEFLRVLDNGRGIDPVRVLRSAQADEIKAHTHGLPASAGSDTNAKSGSSGLQETGSSAVTSSAGGAETRPRNIAFPLWISY